ncbi:MAG: transglutaminase family protein [Bacteroidales bacterium]
MKQLLLILVAIFVISCTEQSHFINDKAYLEIVKNDFEKVKNLAKERESALFSVFNSDITLEEKEALMFLYAYMPLSDLADYDGEFYLRNVRLAFKTKETFSWGKQIPEDIFRHFVLPYRVNNENLDTARVVFYNELSTRLKGMDLKQAILEVNHWCHEKVNYQPTDERTISPLGAVKSTFGRCGEESTFTVTAMRAAGIPARQCYTPRWAHSDDNHAWVEVWVDGSWHFIGACEPEPDLDMAWFSAPALRAMLVNSTVFGKYNGSEEIILKEDRFTNVNMLSNYAPVKTIYAKVINENNEIVNNATVEFQLYNYAEFYPIAKKQVDQNGLASLMTGFGDLIIWAYKDDDFAYQKITVEQTDTVVLKLQPQQRKEYTEFYDIIPPIAKEPKTVPSEGAALNKERLKREDEIREAYAATFLSKIQSFDLAIKTNLDTFIIYEFIQKSRGNHAEIADFITASSGTNKTYIIPVLNTIAQKDLRDTESEILLSHLNHSFTYAGNLPEQNNDLFVKYVMNPRIENEKLIDYKPFLQQAFGEDFINKTKQDIHFLVKWINTEINIDNKANYYNVPITAKGVYELRVADKYSRDLFFVAVCRSFGIPSRLEPATKVPQYYNKKWIDVNFEQLTSYENKGTGIITLINSAENELAPLYRIHYALSKFEKGKYNTLDYGWETPFKNIPKEIELEAGSYMLLTGNRQADGSVLTSLQFFNLSNNEKKEIVLQIRKNAEPLKQIADFNVPNKLKTIDKKSIQINVDEIVIFGWIDAEKEPTKHTLKDIGAITDIFNKMNCKMFLLGNSESVSNKIITIYNLPSTIQLLADDDFKILQSFKTEKVDLPLFIVVQNNKVYYLSEGYQIGIGEQLIKTIKKLEK